MSFPVPSPAFNHVLDIIAVIIVCLATVPANLFPVIYSRRPWSRSFIGRALMVSAIGMALLIDVTVAFYIFGDYPYRNLVRTLVFGLVLTGISLEFTALLRADKDRDLSDENEGESIL